MPRLASLLMVLAWMVLSAMPALAMHLPISAPSVSAGQAMVHEHSTKGPNAAHHASAGSMAAGLANHGCEAATTQAGCDRPCCDGGRDGRHAAGKGCMMAACAGCITLLPQDFPVAWLVLPRDRPTQGTIATLTDNPTRPAERPPRL